MTNHLFIFGQILDKSSVNIPGTKADNNTMTQIFNLLFIFIAALAIFFIVIAGFKYVLAQGDPAKITEAKNQILYALIGLVVVALAAAMVNFVLNSA